MEYIITNENKNGIGDIDVKEFSTRKEAVDMANYMWSHKTALEQKRDKIEVIKSINPDKGADNHFDGDIIKIFE